MMAVKAGVGLIPKSVRTQLKRSAVLESFYSQSLLRSGLFYGYPSAKKITALYRGVIDRQKKVLDALSTVSQLNVAVVTGRQPNDAIMQTLKSLAEQKSQISSVVILGAWHEIEVTGLDIQTAKSWKCLAAQLDDKPLLLLEAGNTLPENAVGYFISCAGEGDVSYCDTDELENGQRHSPRLLPDWNPDLQLSSAYIQTGVMLSMPVAQIDNALKSKPALRSIADLVSLLWLGNHDISVKHLPYSLVHHEPATANIKNYLEQISESLTRHQVEVSPGTEHLINSCQWPLANKPLVSLIIPTKNAHDLVRDCITSILEKTYYENYEILLIDNNSDDPDSLAYFDEVAKHPKVRLLKYPHPFNYSAINNFAAERANGEVIGLINNDVEVIGGQWLSYMVGHALRDDIGCVGAKLLYSDGRIQHAGVVMGYGGGAGHAHKYFPRYHPGYLNRLAATQNYSAVTAACLLVKRKHFEAVGGLNENDLKVAFNDVDFCLKVRALGVRNLYCAEAELFHHESVSRGLDSTKEKRARFLSELTYLQTQWREVIAHDPAYSPHLTLKRENFSVKESAEY